MIKKKIKNDKKYSFIIIYLICSLIFLHLKFSDAESKIAKSLHIHVSEFLHNFNMNFASFGECFCSRALVSLYEQVGAKSECEIFLYHCLL